MFSARRLITLCILKQTRQFLAPIHPEYLQSRQVTVCTNHHHQQKKTLHIVFKNLKRILEIKKKESTLKNKYESIQLEN